MKTLLAVVAILLAADSKTKPAPMPKLRADAPQNVKDYWERAGVAKAREIKAVEERLAEAKGGFAQAQKRDRGKRAAAVKGTRDAIQELNLRLSKVRSREYIPAIPLGRKFRTGSIGSLESVHVDEVLDGKRIVTSFRRSSGRVAFEEVSGGNIAASPEGSDIDTAEGPAHRTVIIYVPDTSKIPEGQSIDFPQDDLYVASVERVGDRQLPALKRINLQDFINAPPKKPAAR